MQRQYIFLFLFLSGIFVFLILWGVSNNDDSRKGNQYRFDKRIDNIGYWVKLAEEGLIPFNPEVRVAPAIFTGSKIDALSVSTEDSPDVPVTDKNSTQSENSVFVNPVNADNLLNSNNSTSNPVPTLGGKFGANGLYSFDAAETWEGEIEGAGGDNSGDPTTAIGLNGRWYVNYINGALGQGISYSDDEGASWTSRTVAANPGEVADKNHMWIDNSPASPYEGNLYIAWTDFGGDNHEQVVLSRSIDDGDTWNLVGSISDSIHAFGHGVHLSTGINGEVYAFWSVYDDEGDEDAIGFSKSLDGGKTWSPATRIIDNIRGIRLSATSKNLRTNSFPVSAVDLSEGPGRGNIYVVWTNIGIPGINTGNDIDIYLIRSEDHGDSWSDPIRVNQDEQDLGNEHFFPWISCDPSNGFLSVIFYDDRNVDATQCEVFCANSDDEGESWEDFRVSDVAFTPAPIPGLAVDYFGDYLGITALNGWVYPVWTDNRLGYAMSWCSPYQTNNLSRPQNLTAEVTFETGEANLVWNYEEIEGFSYFKIYRDDVVIDTVSDSTYIDLLPAYGSYKYRVTAYYTDDLESGGSSVRVQWGNAQISILPETVSEQLTPDSSSVKTIEIANTGQLDLVYKITRATEIPRTFRDYCEAKGGGGEGEYIQRVQFGDIDKTSGSNEYSDYTNLATSIETGETHQLTVTNGNGFGEDQCGAWIDWDQNGIFDEEIINFEGSPGVGPYTALITPPIGAKTGTTRLRIRLSYTGSLNPCGTTIWGEVEDYSVNVKNWYRIDQLADTIPPGETKEIAIHFDATAYDTGMYTASLSFNSNDPDETQKKLDLSLLISDMVVGVSTPNGATTFCSGESIQLMAKPHGKYDSLSYLWSSKPEGFESTEQNPVANPTDSIWYFVEMSSSMNTAFDSIYLNILPQPQFSLGLDTILCGDTAWHLYAGEDGVFYQWSTGENTTSIIVDTTTLFNGYGEREISVVVYNGLKCTTKDTVLINFVNCTGIAENRNSPKISVYPNPGNGVFNVSFDANFTGLVDIFVFDQLGKLVYSLPNSSYNKHKNLKIRLNNLPSGIYQLFIKNKNYVLSKKIIVK